MKHLSTVERASAQLRRVPALQVMMAVPTQNPPEKQAQDATLALDERWLLVQKILASEGFQRAGQLRKILVYISRSAILHPDILLHEHEIACDVLERRHDFDPANDNIVRAQFTHLRRKLERYFSEESPDQPLVLTIPRGSYIPQFHTNERLQKPSASIASAEETVTPREVPSTSSASSSASSSVSWLRGRSAVLLGAGIAVCVALGLGLTIYRRTFPTAPAQAPPNSFLQFLARWEGSVAVVLPDTSFLMIQNITEQDISAADYTRNDYPQRQIDTVQDPEVRRVLNQLAIKRNTTISEAQTGFDLLDGLHRAGAHGTIRYARDLHVRDFSQGNTVLIGSPRSNPWVTLFLSRMNFQFERSPGRSGFAFRNVKPRAGELPVYPVETDSTKDRVNYFDIAFMPNSLQSGYILLVVGSDLEANEAAGNFILHGRLPADIKALLARKDLHSFELFLRGKHIVGESEDSLEVVSVRAEPDSPGAHAP